MAKEVAIFVATDLPAPDSATFSAIAPPALPGRSPLTQVPAFPAAPIALDPRSFAPSKAAPAFSVTPLIIAGAFSFTEDTALDPRSFAPSKAAPAFSVTAPTALDPRSFAPVNAVSAALAIVAPAAVIPVAFRTFVPIVPKPFAAPVIAPLPFVIKLLAARGIVLFKSTFPFLTILPTPVFFNMRIRPLPAAKEPNIPSKPPPPPPSPPKSFFSIFPRSLAMSLRLVFISLK